MKVKDLLQALQGIDPETLVVVDGYEGDYTTPTSVNRIKVDGPHEDAPWYMGEYKGISKNSVSVDAIYIPRK